MVKDIVLVILGAFLGYLIPIFVGWFKKHQERLIQREAKNRKHFFQSGALTSWLLGYYHHSISELYSCEIGGFEKRIPFLTKPTWQFVKEIEPETEWLIKFNEGPILRFETDQALLDHRRRIGARLWPDGSQTLYLDRIGETNGLRLHTKACDYLKMATALIKLEDETFKAVRKSGGYPTPFRDQHLCNLSEITKDRQIPFSVGCTTALALKSENGYQFVLHTRGSNVITYPNMKSVIPNFGLEPNYIEGSKSHFGIIFHNFLKEYLEELFNYEELIKCIDRQRNYPHWFGDFEEAKELINLYKNNQFSLEFIGFGIDALNGTTNIALLAVVKSIEISSKLRKTFITNWEVKKDSSWKSPPLEFIDYKDPLLREWHENGKLQHGCAFTLSLAIKRLLANYY